MYEAAKKLVDPRCQPPTGLDAEFCEFNREVVRRGSEVVDESLRGRTDLEVEEQTLRHLVTIAKRRVCAELRKCDLSFVHHVLGNVLRKLGRHELAIEQLHKGDAAMAMMPSAARDDGYDNFDGDGTRRD